MNNAYTVTDDYPNQYAAKRIRVNNAYNDPPPDYGDHYVNKGSYNSGDHDLGGQAARPPHYHQ